MKAEKLLEKHDLMKNNTSVQNIKALSEKIRFNMAKT
jgi:hypothetical protein